jgi:hypothetical protein
MTKTEIDHLEDGYRWRKYGQKAVKNSPFPRYHRSIVASDVIYSLPSIKLVGRMNVSRHILVLDTSILATSFMERREYHTIIYSILVKLIGISPGSLQNEISSPYIN